MDQQNENNGNQQQTTPAFQAVGNFTPVGSPVWNEPMKHSGLGIASFVISLVAILLSIVAFILIATGIAELDTNGIEYDSANLTESEAMEILSEAPGVIGGVLLFLVTGFLMLIGFILGLVGIFQQHRKKVFSIIGTVLNGLPLVMLILLMALGMAAGI